MTVHFDDQRSTLVEKLSNRVRENFPEKEAKQIIKFLANYYLGVSAQDLENISELDLYGALISHWQFMAQRMPGEIKVKVYNPNLEDHGWQSSHTIIEIICDDQPFLIESIRMALNRMDRNIHILIQTSGIFIKRNSEGRLLNTYHNDKSDTIREAPIYIEIDNQSDASSLEKIQNRIINVIEDVYAMVKDWRAMRNKMQSVITELNNLEQDSNEIIEFLRWIVGNNFTFLGYAEYKLKKSGKLSTLDLIDSTALGILASSKNVKYSREISKMSPEAQKIYLSNQVMLIGKTDNLSTVHRPARTDFISIKIFDSKGKITGEHRFVGLYTSSAYSINTSQIPYVRDKVSKVKQMSRFLPDSHDGKALNHIIENLPRDDLFHATAEEIYNISIGILHLQERTKIRMFIRKDTFGRYYSCIVFVPREIFNSKLRQKMQHILMKYLDGRGIDFDTKFSESILARIHFIIRVDPLKNLDINPELIEEKLVECARTWSDNLKDALIEHHGEEHSNELFKRYEKAFPVSYQEIFTARSAVLDIDYIEKLSKNSESHLEMSLYRPLEDPEDSFKFKLFRVNKTIPLSDIVPILENMGLRIISERPYELRLEDDRLVWINDYRMIHPEGKKLDPTIIKDKFQDAFSAIWYQHSENDRFNSLVISAELSWRDIDVLRAYYKYLWQTGFVFSQSYVEDALYVNAEITRKLIAYFYEKFDPTTPKKSQKKLQEITNEILDALDSVDSLNEDRILRHYLETMSATLRTNFFQVDEDGLPKDFISLKFSSQMVPDLPLPRPMYEIFVYSPEVEGIHLRKDKVARGGLRWSDRHEDFRTEVLGLMKAQQVKNAVIVPLGAKGGFVAKKNIQGLDGKERQQVGISCYKTFIRGLLDITDNRIDNQIIKPSNCICWDDDDPYLVVAADKGTATFSDIANSISKEYNFWLGDAFASGGSAGYDHKKMGITARGAWESVRLHFERMDKDVQKDEFTVVGVGDMAGDVFGNGMLLSDKIKLIAAFNHQHIFIDPTPNPENSFKERMRLFNTPGSAWSDFNKRAISSGGGVFERSAKKIVLTPQIQTALGCSDTELVPNELIKRILCAKVDLFWNGGIGTFVKSEKETNTDVGDRANDAIRINAKQLRVSVVGEGGNLGFTQLARIEFAKNGGNINTDAIDNSAGVNCSDNEVNIKVLLDDIVNQGDMTEKQRNELLASMSDEVSELVLANNRKQNESLTVADMMAVSSIQMHQRLMKFLEKHSELNPEVEFLPDQEELNNRRNNGLGFTRPEIAVLMAYTKIWLKKELLLTDVFNDSYVSKIFATYFPTALQQNYLSYMSAHRLRDAVIATQLSNNIIDEMGINFVHRLQDETGASTGNVVLAYLAASEIFEANLIRKEISMLDYTIDTTVKVNMQQELNRLIRRATRWFLRNHRSGLEVESTIRKFAPLVSEMETILDEVVRGTPVKNMQSERKKLSKLGVPENLAVRISKLIPLFSALDIVEAATVHNLTVRKVAQIYYVVGARLKLGWFRDLVKAQIVRNHWEALARAAFRDDVDRQQRNIAMGILIHDKEIYDDVDSHVETWLQRHSNLLRRWEYFVNELKSTPAEFTMFAVALRELLDLSNAILDTQSI